MQTPQATLCKIPGTFSLRCCSCIVFKSTTDPTEIMIIVSSRRLNQSWNRLDFCAFFRKDLKPAKLKHVNYNAVSIKDSKVYKDEN